MVEFRQNLECTVIRSVYVDMVAMAMGSSVTIRVCSQAAFTLSGYLRLLQRFPGSMILMKS